MKQNIHIIAAIGIHHEIGDGNNLLWHLPKDMQHFKTVTSGHIVLMGRITYESIPKKFRPLPDRINIVISGNKNYQPEENVKVYHSIEEALKQARDLAGKTSKEIFIIGGGKIYEQTIEIADSLHITKVYHNFPDAKVFFPDFNKKNDWHLIAEEYHKADDKHIYDIAFQQYVCTSLKNFNA